MAVESLSLDQGSDPVNILSVLDLLERGRVPLGPELGPFSHPVSDDLSRPCASIVFWSWGSDLKLSHTPFDFSSGLMNGRNLHT